MSGHSGVATPPTAGTRPPWRVRNAGLVRWGRIACTSAILLLAIGFLGREMMGRGDEILRALRALHPAPLGLAWLTVTVGVVITALSWREPLQAVSTPITAGNAVRLFAAGQLGKYVPGVMWSVVLQAQLGASARISSAQIAVTFGVYALISIATGLAVGLPTTGAMGGHDPAWAVAIMVVLVAVTLAALPWALRVLLRRVSHLPPLRNRLAPVDARPLRRSVLLCVASWLVSGLHLWILAVGLGASGRDALLPCVGGFALATVAGSLAFLVPDGLGVREAILVAILSSCLPLPAAVVVATASRVLLVVSDVAMFGYGAWSVHRTGVAPTTPSEGAL